MSYQDRIQIDLYVAYVKDYLAMNVPFEIKKGVPIVTPGWPIVSKGRPSKGKKPMTTLERVRKHRAKQKVHS